MNIDIYIIKSNHLTIRSKILEKTLDILKSLMNKNNYNVNFIDITNPTVEEIQNNLEFYNKHINLNSDEVDDDDFKNAMTKFNLQQLSNLFKHMKAYEIIKNSKTKHNFIIEDDIILLNEYINNFNDFLQLLKKIEYDIILTCLSVNDDNAKIDILLSSVYYKFLITKNSYFITPETAEKLFNYVNIIRFPIKNLLSKFIFDNKSTLKSYILNKHTIFEGSKLGLFPTSVNSNNHLIQNNNYIEFINMLNNNEDINIATQYYMNYGKDNPDFQYILGLIYYKNNKIKESIDILLNAIINLKKNEGFIPQYNDLINSFINISQFAQFDIENCFKKTGIYN